MRFQAGQWVEDDGTPIDPATMQTASQAGTYTSPDDGDTSGAAVGRRPAEDPRKTKPAKRDPRKNRARQ